jgi:hypothetical protein
MAAAASRVRQDARLTRQQAARLLAQSPAEACPVGLRAEAIQERPVARQRAAPSGALPPGAQSSLELSSSEPLVEQVAREMGRWQLQVAP